MAFSSLCLAAHADTFYNFTLTSSDGYAGGSGSFSLNVPPPSTGDVRYTFFGGGGFYTLGDQIDSFAFVYTPPPGAYSATTLKQSSSLNFIEFTDGAVAGFTGFNYAGGAPSCPSQLSIGSTSYSYSEGCVVNGGFPKFYNDVGTVTITPAAVVGTTPEPSGVVLLGTGLLGMVGLVRRRFCAESCRLCAQASRTGEIG